MVTLNDCFSNLSNQLLINLRLMRREQQLDVTDSSCLWSILKEIPGSVIIPSSLAVLRAFEEELNISEISDDTDAICCQYLLLVASSLQDRWKSIFRFFLNFQICKEHLQHVQPHVSVLYLKNVLHAIYCVIKELQKTNHEINFGKNSTITLCLHQIKSSLPLLLKAHQQENAYVTKYVSKCLMDCLDNIANDICEHSQLPYSEFLDLMDCVLSVLEAERPSATQLAEVQEQIDELLCHAMATAQVAVLQDDRERIKSKSQVVLRELKNLKDAVSEDDKKEIRHLSNVLSDALCEMERSVNNAVLRLVVDVCSGIQDPIRSLVDRCKPDCVSSPSQRQSSDLDEDIITFDEFMDRLMQVGTFAVSCSSNAKKAMQLRSCLASFESLEAEVVPCVTALYLDSCKSNKVALRLILERWHNEFNLYHQLLASIVDPTAYVHVVLSYLRDQRKLMDNDGKFVIRVTNVTKVAKSLQPVMLTTFEQDSLADTSIIKGHSHKINKVVKECLKFFEKSTAEDRGIQKEKILRNINDLILEVELLGEALAKQLLESETELESIGAKLETSSAKNYYKLCVSEANGTDVDLLTPIAARGLQMVKDAVLYNTPKRSAVKRSIVKTPAPRSAVRNNVPPSTVRSRCFRTPAVANLTQQAAESMELTHLLEELTKLDDTFSNSTVVQPKKEALCGKQLLQLFESLDMSVCSLQNSQEAASTGVGSSLDSHCVGSFERMRDLELVQDKIETLKASDEQYVTVINIS